MLAAGGRGLDVVRSALPHLRAVEAVAPAADFAPGAVEEARTAAADRGRHAHR